MLDNAVKLSPEGRPVVVAARGERDGVRVSVTDGPGIDPADQEHIFDRLWQAKRSIRAGLGLGLSVARPLVRAHEGHIEVESTPGHGSTFRFTLPGAEGGAAAVARTSRSARSAWGTPPRHGGRSGAKRSRLVSRMHG